MIISRRRVRSYVLAMFALLSISATTLYAQADAEIYDPIEPVNRGIFWFNDKADIYLLEPVARGYDSALPAPVKRGVGNFFSNLRYPQYLVSDLIELEFGRALRHTGRFLVNSTAGVAGLFDVASDLGLAEEKRDVALALASHGVPPGPYLVLPFLGPSNLRDALGRAVDTVLNPLFWVQYSNASDSNQDIITYGATALWIVHSRADMLEAVETAKNSSLDYYLFSQGAYYQYRRGLLKGKMASELQSSESLDDDIDYGAVSAPNLGE